MLYSNRMNIYLLILIIRLNSLVMPINNPTYTSHVYLKVKVTKALYHAFRYLKLIKKNRYYHALWHDKFFPLITEVKEN